MYTKKFQKQIYRVPTELVLHSSYMGSKHRCKSTASYKIYMVRLYRSPIPERRGAFNVLI